MEIALDMSECMRENVSAINVNNNFLGCQIDARIQWQLVV